MQKKKLWSRILSVILCALTLTGCTGSVSDTDTGMTKKSIVCTTFPSYDWTREILGAHSEEYELTLLLDKGGDIHSYQPTAKDIAAIASADLFVYVGGESDEWVAEVLRNAGKQDMLEVNLMEALGDAVKEEETVDGMREHHHGEVVEEAEYDEHVWLSLKNAEVLTQVISDKIKQLDEVNSEDYAANEKVYVEQLKALDKEYADAVSASNKKTLLFGDRFPFRYLTDDYGLTYYAAFTGCSTETDASFETITFLSGKTDELGLSVILTIENSDRRIAGVIKQNTRDKDQEILTLNSLQSVTAKDIDNGFTYLKAMRDNLEVLKKALH